MRPANPAGRIRWRSGARAALYHRYGVIHTHRIHHGGVLIGIAAAGLLMFHGRIAGISGIAGGIFRQRQSGDTAWRVMFLVGLFAAGVIWSYFRPEDYAFGIERSTVALIIAGLTVGIGTQIGSGCTSGHGVCGIGRLSKRSTVATVTFMATAAITVFIVNEVLGGAV